MQADLLAKCKEYAEHMAALGRVAAAVVTLREDGRHPVRPADDFCARCNQCRALSAYQYGCHEAYRWNGQYVYYCPLSLTFVASRVADSPVSEENGNLVGGIVLGPMIMGDAQDVLDALPEPSMRGAAEALPVLTAAQVNHLASVLCACTAFVSGLPHSRAGSFVYAQDKLLQAIYNAQDRMQQGLSPMGYPIEYEKRLHQMILAHDRMGAQQLLNELLGHIYCANNFDLQTIKTRVVELVVLVSRATIDAGADVREILVLNGEYIRRIE
ncbi:MAG TPA: PocR ligand-binding domain-containing protein, partial [Clostridia bacterium]|nr:PocR ligand-binding domain-containing protein [Clostridia bacterium]